MALRINCLITELSSGCGPEARFLLEALALRGGDVVGAKELARKLCVAEKLVRDALGELVSAELVFQRVVRSRGRGRPALRYEISEKAKSTLLMSEHAYGVHADLIYGLFSSSDLAVATWPLGLQVKKEQKPVGISGRPAPPGGRGRLSACNRLLLATLLARSDQFGVVAIGKSELRQLTGFDEASLDHRLRRLVCLRLIFAYVPGLSCTLFSGGRVSSTYLLNLPALWEGLIGRKDFVVIEGLWWEHSSQYLSRSRLLGSSEQSSARGGAVASFWRDQREASFAVMRVWLLRCASFVCSLCGDNLKTGHSIVDQQVRRTVSVALQRPVSWAEEEFDSDWEHVIDHFYRLVIEIARTVQWWRAQDLGIEVGSWEWLLWPCDDRQVLRIERLVTREKGVNEGRD